ncbi:MAG: hypothetical protein CMH61_01890 [Nanoarchaeota archaeon]|nr:hypothetical protein [Nanoarchaeota archaeon]|tara:strand:+ start:4295 stop:5017 length:723 start_codon:yes stop_codon:yes gene_type:complete
MIRNSFVFLEKIRSRKEKSILKQVSGWNEFLRSDVKGISSQRKQYYNRKIKEAQRALINEDASYFIDKLPGKEMWRLYDYFKEDCCFLDIEVDSYGNVILVGISNYYDTNFFVKGVNLSKESIGRQLEKYKITVTFNGSSFDLPKLKKLGVTTHVTHIDLKPLCVNLGLKGGLKEIEKKLDLRRPSHLYGNPVDLWKSFHASGEKEWLQLLMDYNAEDCENLKLVMQHVYKEMCAKIYKH